MSETAETTSFRNKPRNRKGIYAEAMSENAKKAKTPAVKQSKPRKGKFVGVRLKPAEADKIAKMMEVYGYTEWAAFIKECVWLRGEIESFRLEKAREMRAEMRRLGITPRMLDE